VYCGPSPVKGPPLTKGLCDDSLVRLVPTEALLEICPLQAVPGIFGCVSRRDVAERRVDFESKSVVDIAPEHGDGVVNVSTVAGEWLQGLLGTSEYHRQLGYNHSLIMNNKYKLNARYRRGFMISPTVPWRDADAGGAKTLLQLAQFSISAVMLSLDTRTAGTPLSAQRRRTVSQMMLSVPREITSTDNNENVARAVCNRSLANCELMTVSQAVSVEDFCLAERDFVAQKQEEMAADFIAWSHQSVATLHITSVLKTGFEHVCKQQTRRLLATETVHITFAVGTSGPYVLASDRLRVAGYSNVTLLSRNASLLQWCDTTVPVSCVLTTPSPEGAVKITVVVARKRKPSATSMPIVGVIIGSSMLILIGFALLFSSKTGSDEEDRDTQHLLGRSADQTQGNRSHDLHFPVNAAQPVPQQPWKSAYNDGRSLPALVFP